MWESASRDAIIRSILRQRGYDDMYKDLYMTRRLREVPGDVEAKTGKYLAVLTENERIRRYLDASKMLCYWAM